MSYANRAQVAGKIDHEGGIMDALEYGLMVDDMPEGDHELRQAWAALKAAYAAIRPLEDAVERLFDAAGDDMQDESL